MKYFVGIDLGTSSVKLLLVAGDGTVLNSVTEYYPVIYPRDGWSEQNPEDWYDGTINGIKKLMNGFPREDVAGVGVGGQMHGLVLLDKDDKVIRPCILWNDGRTEQETAYLNDTVGRNRLSEYTANIAFAGFTAPKILWLKKNEPENFNKTVKIMLPKDYLVYRLCGAFTTDCSDASGTLFFDVKNRDWSPDMCRLCDIRDDMLPKIRESSDPVGTLKPEVAELLGLPRGVTVCAGAGDNAAAAIGTGTINNGDCNISLGTSGTVFISKDEFSVDEKNSLHSFAHANGKYHLMGCILSAASALGWWTENILNTSDFAEEQAGAETFAGRNDLFFLPYLTGERSPHNDVNARGAFIGLNPSATRRQMTLAVMEGVAFALRDCVEIAKSCGAPVTLTRIFGGGAKSPLWRQIRADVLNVPVETPATREGPAYGGAMLAAVACGEFKDVQEVTERFVTIEETVYPCAERAAFYDKRYKVFKKLYPALKDVYKELRET